MNYIMLKEDYTYFNLQLEILAREVEEVNSLYI